MNLDDKKISELAPLHAALGALEVLATDATSHGTRSTKVHDPEERARERRAFVRAVFALVESMIYVLKQLCLEDHFDAYSPAELAVLQEKRYDVKENGDIDCRPVFISLDRNFRSAHKLYAKGSGISFKPDYSLKGWDSLLKAKKVRNRITHPKTTAGLNVTKKEFEETKQALKWAVDVMRTAVKRKNR